MESLAKTTPSIDTCIVYVMSRQLFTSNNQCLMSAQAMALQHKVPLAVIFCLHKDLNLQSVSQYLDLLKRLSQIEVDLQAKNIPFLLMFGEPLNSIQAFTYHTKPLVLYVDPPSSSAETKLQAKITAVVPRVILVDETINTGQVIVKHSYDWPGVVKTMAELDSYIQEFLKSV